MTGLRDRLSLIVITDPSCGEGRAIVDVVRAALRGGAPSIQLRGKDQAAREQVELARALRVETRAAGALLWVNDRLDVALAAGADGVHLGQDDLPVEAARRIVPGGFLIGISAETAELARAAERGGADYVGAGPVYETGSKADAGSAVGCARIAQVAAAVRIPVVGIGGIAAANAGEVVRAGAAGVAVISAVMRAADPEAATRELLRAATTGRS
ncbi:thiamine phosphate synthase [Longimicrobium sp.]|uniref:thiamine phosphate synthase n=1 Tax=Longimicrobium sp. TaxID=2029185 RepID=UPI002BE05AF0|nr:thiamine phosphate synthase [Longimicrobium sp.]HSU12989.1 thiamine phosphate synthase [Longimicrobium sp.]